MGREKEYPLTPELEANLSRLLIAVNKLAEKYGRDMAVSSGYRPGHYNVKAGGSRRSAHLTCEAVDFLDSGRQLTEWILANPAVLQECGLWMEHPDHTPTWVHLDTRPRNNRIFHP